MIVTKQHIVDAIRAQYPAYAVSPKPLTKWMVDMVFHILTQYLRDGDTVILKGFGSFRVDRVSRGFNTAGPNMIKKTVRFKAFEDLRKYL